MLGSADTRTISFMPTALPGFEGIKRYWNREQSLSTAKVLPGEYYVTVSREMITTVLGSCVSACICDPLIGIGGMNHFMLPRNNGNYNGCWNDTMVNAAARYGNYAMEHMINEIIKHGGRREYLEIKIFGGGKVLTSMTDVGRSNIEFVMDYLQTEGFSIAAKDVGGIFPRKVNYYPQSGKVWIKKLKSTHNNAIVYQEQRYMEDIENQPVGGEVDLF